MPVDSSTVEIVVNVRDANSGAAIAGVEKNLTQLGTAGRAAGEKVAVGLRSSGDSLESLAKGFTAGEGSIRTMNAEVRSLQGSIFGDTRAASEFLATLPGVGEAMELAFPVFGASALIGVIGLGTEKVGELPISSWISIGPSGNTRSMLKMRRRKNCSTRRLWRPRTVCSRRRTVKSTTSCEKKQRRWIRERLLME